MRAEVIPSATTISATFSRWHRFLNALMALLVIELVLAATIRIRLLDEVLSGERPFHLLESLSAVGLLLFPAMLYAIHRIRVAQRELDLLVASEKDATTATRVLLDTTIEGIYGIDAEGVCTMANRAAGLCLGYEPEELIGKNMHALVHHTRSDGTSYPVEAHPIFNALIDGEAREVEDEIMWRKDGSGFSGAYSSAPIMTDEGVKGAVVTFRNIDERKRMEATVRDNDLRTRSFLEELPLGVFIVDQQGRPMYSNRLAVELLGVHADRSVEKSDLAHAYQVYVAGTEELYDPARIPVIRALAGETLTVDDIEIHKPDGTIVPLEVSASPVRDKDGVIRYAASAFNDISSRREAEDAIHAARQEADRANLAKSEFLSRMSHELRTPLNAILGFAQLLEMDDLEPRQLEGTQQIIKGGRRLLELINEVLDISRIESGHLALSLEPVLLRDVVEECVALIKPLAEEQGIRVQADGIDKNQHVLADRHRLGQVMLNLLSNAVKYNVPEGTVTITCTEPKGKFIRLGVTDTGPGIPAGDVPLLFTPFERLRADGSAVEGTGLGLALSQKLVEAIGGEIIVDTMEGRGSTFWVELPATDQPHVEPVEAPIAVEERARPDSEYRILLIEDNKANLRLIERILERRMEFQIISAMSGSLGLDLARQQVPDLILLDLGLPDISGDEVFSRLRKDPKTANIPVVILSADATRGEIERLLAKGAEHYLTKPIDVPEFIRVLEETLTS